MIDTENNIQNNNIEITEETSKRITSLRFILIVLVIFIHSNLTVSEAIDYNYDFIQPVWVEIIKNIFCYILGNAAVPLFFLFSSYLQFSKNDKYVVLLKKRCKSLLIPYILWTFFYIFLFYLVQLIPQISSYFQNPDNIIRNWDFFDWLKAFTYQKFSSSGNYPFVFQFWFIRDLIILIILSPLLKLLMEKIPYVVIILVSIFAITNTPILFIDRASSLFFYVAGYFFATYKVSFFHIADKIKIWEYFILLLLYCLFQFVFQGKYNFGFLGIIISCLFFLKLSYYFVRNDKIYSKLKYLAQYSFFLYAVHTPFIGTAINKITQKVIPLHGIFCLIQFLAASILTLFIGTIIAFIFKKIFPRLFKILSGGR